jgi:hypothetical protein
VDSLSLGLRVWWGLEMVPKLPHWQPLNGLGLLRLDRKFYQST